MMTNKGKRKYKVRVLDIAPLRESSPQRSGVLKNLTVLPARSSTIEMSHTCLCLPSYRVSDPVSLTSPNLVGM